jgi:hypothetical protein
MWIVSFPTLELMHHANTTLSYTFYFFAGINVVLAFFVFFFIPETRRVSIEEMDVLFGGSNHVEKGGDLLQVEDTHHANFGVDNAYSRDRDNIVPVTHIHQHATKF